MKRPPLLTLGALALALASCGSLQNFNQPLSGSGNFDPLSSPGSSSTRSSAVAAPTSPSYSPGQWVETSMPNATFFRSIPKGNAQADKVLPVSTPLKVVSNKGTYVQVELDSGDVGYVPEIMVIERGNPSEVPVTNPIGPVPDLGTIPPPVDPGDFSGTGIAPAPNVPSIPPPVPEVPGLPAVPPPIPDAAPPLPEVPPTGADLPTVPDVAPPPEVPGISDPVEVD